MRVTALKTEAVRSSEKSVNSTELHGVKSWRTFVVIVTAEELQKRKFDAMQ
jgi:hypothetical protein